MKQSKGFSLVEVVLVVVVLGIIGFVGYRVAVAQLDNKTADQNAAAQTSVSTNSVPAIQTSEDLDAATQTLDSTDVESDDSALLNEQLNF